jgi:membrane protein
MRALLRSFVEHDLLTYSSAIAFQLFFALIPLLLMGLGLLGLFSLGDVWTQHLAPQIRPQVSGAVFEVIESTVRRVLGSRQLFWATIGVLLAVWKVSGAMRGVMTVLDRIYDVHRRRSWRERYAVSIGLSALVIAMLLFAGGLLVAGGLAGGPAGILCWPVAAVPLLGALAAVLRWGPAEERPWHLVTLGSGLVVLAWLAMSALFGFYLRDIAEYGSIFGNLATLIITLEYIYLSSIVFLGGLALDGLLEREENLSRA